MARSYLRKLAPLFSGVPHLATRRVLRGATFSLLGLLAAYASADLVQSLVYSATALAMAFVMATKEMIAGLFGGIVRRASQTMAVGDLIEIGSVRGTLKKAGLFMTSIEESEDFPNLGCKAVRTVLIPNGRFFEDCVIVQPQEARSVTTRFELTFESTRSMAEVAAWWDEKVALGKTQNLAEVGATLDFTLATTAGARPCVVVALCSAPAEAACLRRELTVAFLDWLRSNTDQGCASIQPAKRAGDVVLELVA
ncbi:mechanosensitive ion channel [Fulvimarina sp. 2208YS6-2-32]|uniref:Mechanosensitive ion channel n=1 Tax=Fulvimarina uroteuthidis TaxID=3098149 RepID=A0ABU5I4Z6_9HYPH|nr:mechanosensitive ion channel domain-containing protein [Fulvimarina sp. 2208YS6-2-32]MDY8110170.1 mechanosensitive ion channel [Fulvimarina sp. 2208YS6-2-32]